MPATFKKQNTYQGSSSSTQDTDSTKQHPKLDQQTLLCYLSRGIRCMKQKNYSEAVNFFDSVAQIKSPHQYKAYHLKAKILSNQLKHIKEAQRCYLEAIKSSKQQYQCYKLLAEFYQAKGRFSKALYILKMYSKLFPRHIQCLHQQGKICKLMHHDMQARQKFMSIIKIDEKNAQAYYQIGLIYYKLKKYNQAFQNFREAYRLDKNKHQIKLYLAAVYQKFDMYEQCRKLLASYRQNHNPTPFYEKLKKCNAKILQQIKKNKRSRSQKDHQPQNQNKYKMFEIDQGNEELMKDDQNHNYQENLPIHEHEIVRSRNVFCGDFCGKLSFQEESKIDQDYAEIKITSSIVL